MSCMLVLCTMYLIATIVMCNIPNQNSVHSAKSTHLALLSLYETCVNYFHWVWLVISVPLCESLPFLPEYWPGHAFIMVKLETQKPRLGDDPKFLCLIVLAGRSPRAKLKQGLGKYALLPLVRAITMSHSRRHIVRKRWSTVANGAIYFCQTGGRNTA